MSRWFFSATLLSYNLQVMSLWNSNLCIHQNISWSSTRVFGIYLQRVMGTVIYLCVISIFIAHWTAKQFYINPSFLSSYGFDLLYFLLLYECLYRLVYRVYPYVAVTCSWGAALVVYHSAPFILMQSVFRRKMFPLLEIKTSFFYNNFLIYSSKFCMANC